MQPCKLQCCRMKSQLNGDLDFNCFIGSLFSRAICEDFIGADKRWYQIKCYLFLNKKHLLWVLIRSILDTCNEYPQYMLSWRNKKKFNTFYNPKNSFNHIQRRIFTYCNSYSSHRETLLIENHHQTVTLTL